MRAPKGVRHAQALSAVVRRRTKGATVYAKTPAGTGLPAHWHSATEYTVLLAGKGTLTLDGKQHEVAPGGYVVIPAKAVHQFVCSAGTDCLLFTRRGGPTDYNFVK
jgi:quercetin dioxygenase-like cupin family protein